MLTLLRRRYLYTCMTMLSLMIFYSGCADTSYQTESELPSVSTIVEGNNDIELPSEMKWDGSKSMVIKTDSFQGGIHSYSGRVEINSLKAFIISSMRKNKWKHVGEASYKDYLLAFTKANKTCMVTLSETIGGSFGKTNAIFYVTVDVAAEHELYPFDQSVK